MPGSAMLIGSFRIFGDAFCQREWLEEKERLERLAALFDVHLSDHPGLVMPRDIAGKFEVYRLGEFPDYFRGLAGFEQHAVRIIVFHGFAAAHIHLHHVVVDFVGFEYAMLHHRHHFLLMTGMHGGGSDVEFMDEFALVQDPEPDRLAGLDVDFFRFEEVFLQGDVDGPGDTRRLAGRTEVKLMWLVFTVFAMPALHVTRLFRMPAAMGSGGIGWRGANHQGCSSTGDSGKILDRNRVFHCEFSFCCDDGCTGVKRHTYSPNVIKMALIDMLGIL